MKFKFTTTQNTLEIDLGDFISKYSQVNTKIDSICGAIRSKEKLESCITKMTNVLESSTVIIKKRKSEKSVAFVKITGKVVSTKTGFYLTFSTINNNKRYTYSIKLVSNLSSSKSGVLNWKRYNIEIEDLENETLKSGLSHGIKNPEIKNLGLNISFKGISMFLVIVSSLIYSVTEAFSYFVG